LYGSGQGCQISDARSLEDRLSSRTGQLKDKQAEWSTAGAARLALPSFGLLRRQADLRLTIRGANQRT